MRKFWIVNFSIFFFFLFGQTVHATSFWDYFNNGYYDNSYNYDYYNNNYDYSYTSSCPNMSYYDYYTQLCQCYDGYVWYDYECISQSQYCQRYLGPNSRYERSNNSCMCQSGYEMEGQSCIYKSRTQNQPQREYNPNYDSRNQPINNEPTSRPFPTDIPPIPRNTPIPNTVDDRPWPTTIPPVAASTPLPPFPTHEPNVWPTPWPSVTPRPIPTWLLNYNQNKTTPTPIPSSQNETCINPSDGKECTNINIGNNPNNNPAPTLIPAQKVGQVTTLTQDTNKTATTSGFWQWVSSWLGKK